MDFNTVIIDGPYLSHRSYDAPYNLFRSDGQKVTQIHSFLRSLILLNKKFQPERIAVAWESHGTQQWRRVILPSYKSSRHKISDEFITQQEDLKEILHKLNIEQFSAPGNEADDVIAALTENYPKPIAIHTTDKDIMQLLNDKIRVWDGKKLLGPDFVEKRYGVSPERLRLLLSITGDASDDIPGISGVGPVKAKKILDSLLGLNTELFEVLESLGKERAEIISRNLKLIRLNNSCKLEPFETTSKLTINQILDKYELFKIQSELQNFQVRKSNVVSLERFF